jgi:hypothetical protein
VILHQDIVTKQASPQLATRKDLDRIYALAKAKQLFVPIGEKARSGHEKVCLALQKVGSIFKKADQVSVQSQKMLTKGLVDGLFAQYAQKEHVIHPIQNS